MYFVCSAFFNIGKKRNDIVSFSYQVFPLYFPAGESALAETVPGLEKVRDRREKITIPSKLIGIRIKI